MFKQIKRIIFLCAVIFMMFTGTFAAEADTTILVDGKQIVPDAPVVDNKGVNMVSLLTLHEALGLQIGYLDETATAIIEKGDIKVRVTLGKETGYKNGEPFKLSAPSMIAYQRMYVPLKNIAEVFGVRVEWDQPNNKLQLWTGSGLENVKWSLSIPQIVSGKPVLYKNSTILVPSGNTLMCIDLQGNIKWKTVISPKEQTEESQYLGTPTIAPDGTIYIASSDIKTANGNYTRQVVHLDSEGKIIRDWSHYGKMEGFTSKIPGEVTLAKDNRFYVNMKDNLYCIYDNGQVRWIYLGERDFAPPVIYDKDDNKVALLMYGKGATIYGIDKNGKRIWDKQITGEVKLPWLLDSATNKVYVFTNSTQGQMQFSRINELEFYNGINKANISWTWSDADTLILSSPLISLDKMYVPTNNGLYVINTQTKQVVKKDIKNLLPVTPAVDSKGNVYVITSPGNIQEIKADGQMGQLIELKAPITELSCLSNGLLVVTKDLRVIFIEI